MSPSSERRQVFLATLLVRGFPNGLRMGLSIGPVRVNHAGAVNPSSEGKTIFPHRKRLEPFGNRKEKPSWAFVWSWWSNINLTLGTTQGEPGVL